MLQREEKTLRTLFLPINLMPFFAQPVPCDCFVLFRLTSAWALFICLQ